MNKLRSELQRLYFLPLPADAASTAPAVLSGADDQVRALVMELRRAPDWELLARVWQGVQAELELPAPAIAVSGTDAMQLWFSLAEPVPAAQGQAFLQALRQRFLPEVDARRLRLLPDGAPLRHADLVPAPQDSGNWSAFVAPDLAPVFGDTPWLDIPPNEEGQAGLLRGLASMPRAAFEAALQALAAATPDAAALPPAVAAVATPAPVAAQPAPGPATAALRPQHAAEAARFLRSVMDDETVPLALRIEAAKALLQDSGRQG